MSEQPKRKRGRPPKSTKEDDTKLEERIAELEAKIADFSSRVMPETAPATDVVPPQEVESVSAVKGSPHGTLPAGFKSASGADHNQYHSPQHILPATTKPQRRSMWLAKGSDVA